MPQSVAATTDVRFWADHDPSKSFSRPQDLWSWVFAQPSHELCTVASTSFPCLPFLADMDV